MIEKSVGDLGIPLFPGFLRRVLPVLAVYWFAAFFVTLLGYPMALVIAVWATATTIMVWPVASGHARYLTIRHPWFLVAVASMADIPIASYFMIGPTSSLIKYIALISLVVDIGIWGIAASLKRVFGKPLKMLFRPDLLFGDGRILAGSIVAIGFGMKFMFTNMPPGNVPIGQWYAIFAAMVLGLIQIIPLRGMMKMRNGMSRMLFGRMNSLWATMVHELYLVVAVFAIMFSFSNFFAGVIPFTKNIMAGSNLGLTLIIVSSLFIIIVRSLYKKYTVGDPFAFETRRQSVVKNAILAIGLVGFVYGLIIFMVGGGLRTVNTGANAYLTIMGASLLTWGVILLVFIRSWAQENRRAAITAQTVEILLPNVSEDVRRRAMSKMMPVIAHMPKERRIEVVGWMMNAMSEMPEHNRMKVMKTQMLVMSELADEERKAIMEAQNVVMK